MRETIVREIVEAPHGPRPRGPYSMGVIGSGRLLFVGGQLPIDPENQEMQLGTFDEQAKRVFENVRLVVDAAGGSLTKAVKVNVYLADLKDRPKLDEIYTAVFPRPYPARTTTCSPLAAGASIEVDAIVALD